MSVQIVPGLESEFRSVALGDERLNKRLLLIARSLGDSPAESFPKRASSDGELEGVYRFLSNSRVSPESVLAPHYRATLDRCGDSDVLVLHDTTGFVFRGEDSREGLGRVQRSGRRQSRQGFFGHFALACSADDLRQPLGVVGMKTFVREKAPKTKAEQQERGEAARWTQLASEVQSRMPNAIHVMDREADSYINFQTLVSEGLRFIIRGRIGWKRVATSDGISDTIPELAGRTPVRLTRDVRISPRKRNDIGVLSKVNAPREGRTANLTVRATRVDLPCSFRRGRTSGSGPSVSINVVYVDEEAPPPGAEPISWMLFTSEPIATTADVERIVDGYRARWTIEEFFKALKTGCAFEKRQLESLDALCNALAVFSVIAWRLLLLRSISRIAPSADASTVATKTQICLLRALPTLSARYRDIRLSKTPTAHEALLAIAELGGFIKNNGRPGWQIIGRGYDALLLLELGSRLAKPD